MRSGTRNTLMSCFTFVATISVCGMTTADLLDFENASSYGGDDSVIADSYFNQYGLSINAMAGNNSLDATRAVLSFEASGKDGTDGFWSSRNGRDEAFAGDLGNFFLKAGTGDLSYNKATYFKMDIDYTQSTNAASGEIWDIDGPEQYTVTAFDANGNQVASLVSPTGGLNAEPWLWSVDVGPTREIARISISASGDGTLRGFAFDNFNATEANPNASTHAAPTPAALPLCLIGLGYLGLKRRKKNALTG